MIYDNKNVFLQKKCNRSHIEHAKNDRLYVVLSHK